MEIVQEENKEIFAKIDELVHLRQDTAKWIEEKDFIQKAQKWIEENKDNFKKLPDLSEEVLKLISERDNFLKYPELIKEIQKITEIDDDFLEYTETIKKIQRLFKEIQRLVGLSDNPLKYADIIENVQTFIEANVNHNPFLLVESFKEIRGNIEENRIFLKLTESNDEVKRLIEEKKVNPNYIFFKLDELNDIISSIFLPKFEQLKENVVENLSELSDNFYILSKRQEKIIDVINKNEENYKKIIEGEEIPYIDINKELENVPKLRTIDKIELQKLLKMCSACSEILSSYGVWKFWAITIESAIFIAIVAFSLFSFLVPDKLISVVIALICTLVAYILDKTLFAFLKNKLLYRVCNKIFLKINIMTLELFNLQYKDTFEKE